MDRYLPGPNKRQIIVLTGARQTGKTTLAIQKYHGLRHVNIDAPEKREVIRNTATPLWAYTIGNAVIDEAQKEPSLFEKVKYAFDDGGISFSLLLGSAQILLLKRIRESLAGRAAIYELWPLLMSEIHSDEDHIRTPLIGNLLKN